MPGGGALELAPRAADAWQHDAVVLVRDDDERRAAEARGFTRTLYKPFAEDEVAGVIAALAGRIAPGK
jgi:hypothetical protein